MAVEEIEGYSYTVSKRRRGIAPQPRQLSADELQSQLLQGVSRTFALTIPQLPTPLAGVVANAYLLCRIVDTIEDEPALSPEQKHEFCRQFVQVVAGETPAERFATGLSRWLSEHTIPAEHELIQYTPGVIGITHGLNPQQQEALRRCVELMAYGMVEFQLDNDGCGLENLAQMDRYCYYVAGVVGEMLTRLFCDYSADIAKNKETLMSLAVSFGQGLQMTNILKDIWDDKHRGVCWLPQDIFTAAGFDLNELAPGHYQESFGYGLEHLISIAHGHLKNALAYTLLIPKHETGIRNFCLWAIGMAMLTLRKLNKHRNFSDGKQVKISRRSVKATVIASRLTAAHDYGLKSLFKLAGIGLPDALRYSH